MHDQCLICSGHRRSLASVVAHLGDATLPLHGSQVVVEPIDELTCCERRFMKLRRALAPHDVDVRGVAQAVHAGVRPAGEEARGILHVPSRLVRVPLTQPATHYLPWKAASLNGRALVPKNATQTRRMQLSSRPSTVPQGRRWQHKFHVRREAAMDSTSLVISATACSRLSCTVTSCRPDG